ncbi:hypothetical protein [Pseudomonas bananamidigenes]|uniref:hypothetical protein n=1 Tax=Pseudomonas bananamidigenes TaxID=2843610 RepID=UPI000803B6C4|nr:hypothetical protein [Pseudomonas bananamidigenes]
MSEREIDTEHNFVKNGDMTEGYDYWDVVSNAVGFVIRTDQWGDTRVSIMTLTNLAAVRQRMVVPIGQQAQARYSLRFLYENTYPNSVGRVVLNKRGSVEKFEIELPAKAKLADPFAVDLLEMQEDLPDRLGLQAGDELEINLSSPKREVGEPSSVEIRLTGIEIKLNLPALALEAVINDGKRFDSGSVLPICLGASGEQRHRISFAVDSQSVWNNLEASLWLEDNPLEAITAEPGLGQSQLIGLDWLLDCPEPSGKEPYELNAKIYSKYSAPPHPLLISWGHHRLDLLALKEAETYPVIEYNQSVELQIQVRSFYTHAPVVGEVVWRVERHAGTILQRAPTDARGRATYQYTPTEEGVSRVTASVVSPLSDNGEATHTFEVRAFAIDPFKTLLARFDGGTPAAWGEKTRYPERGEAFPVDLNIPAGHPLGDATFSLNWGSGDSPADVGATSVPDFEEQVAVAGDSVLWNAHFEDKRDGVFDWILGCSRLQHLSRGNAMSLAYNKIEIGKTWGPNKSPVVDERDVVTCMVQVQRRDRQPVSNVEIEFDTPAGPVRSVTGVDGWGSVDHLPASAGDYAIVARVQRHEDAPVDEHPFAVKALPTSAWKGQVNVSLDGKPVDRLIQGVVCRRGRAHKLRIDPVEGSSFIGKSIALDWNRDTPPLPGFQLSPAAGVAREMSSSGLEWDIVSDPDKSGFSTLAFSSSHLPEVREIPLRLLGSDLAGEIRMMLDHVSAEPDTNTLYPCLWATHKLTLMPIGVSALHGLSVKTAIAPIPPGLVIDPPLSTDVFMTAGGARRELNFSNSSDDAVMTLTETVMLGEEALTAQTQLMLGHNKIKSVAARGPAIDPVLSKGQRARVQARFYSAFADRPVESSLIEWRVGSADPINVPTNPDGWSLYDAQSHSAGISTVSATALNLYDQTTAVQHFELYTLPYDPWNRLRLVTELSEGLWGQHALFPRRAESFSFDLQADDDNPLRSQRLAVGLDHPAPSELGLEFNEVLGEFRDWTSGGLKYSFNAGDIKDGGVSVRLAASRLLELSPPQPMSLGTQAIAARINASAGVSQTVDWGKPVVCEVRLTNALTGKAMANVRVMWELPEQQPKFTTTNFHGLTSISFIPQHAGPGTVRAVVVGGADSASVYMNYSVNEPRRIESLTVDMNSGLPGQEVIATVMVVSARSGKPLRNVSVKWALYGIKIEPTETGADGCSRVVFRIPPIRDGRLDAIVEGGLIGREVKSMKLSAEVDSITWLQEFKLTMDRSPIDLVDGELQLFSKDKQGGPLELHFEEHSWLRKWVSIALENVQDTELKRLKFEPELGVERVVDKSPMRWWVSIDGEYSPIGPFKLKFTSPQLPDLPLSGLVRHSDSLTMLIDGIVSPNFYLKIGKIHTVRFLPLDGFYVGKEVRLIWSEISNFPGQDIGVLVTPPTIDYQLMDADKGVEWTFDCTNALGLNAVVELEVRGQKDRNLVFWLGLI